MQYVILAAGIGKRLRPITETMSKAMIHVANKPILEWTLDAIDSRDVFVVVRKEQKDIIEHFQGRCDFVYQDKPKGTADAMMQVKDYISDDFLAMNVDEFITKNDMQKLSRLKESHVACHQTSRPELYGILHLNRGKIVDIEEKPEKPKSNLVNSGIYVFNETVFSAINKIKPSPRGELEITDAIKFLINDGTELLPFMLEDWHTITYPWDLLDVNEFLLSQHGSQIAESAEIRSGAVIEETAAIGNNAIIGPNCYIRKNSSIGNGCKIGNAVEIKNSIIMENSYVSHLSYVGDSIVGRNCNVAAGSIFANLRLDEKTVGMKIDGAYVDSGHKKLGAIVGDNVKFGVNVTVMPGKKIWPNIMVPPGMTVDEDIEKQPDFQKKRDE